VHLAITAIVRIFAQDSVTIEVQRLTNFAVGSIILTKIHNAEASLSGISTTSMDLSAFRIPHAAFEKDLARTCPQLRRDNVASFIIIGIAYVRGLLLWSYCKC
jgi:hypothetical protein